MNFSYNWLRELVDGLDAAAREAGQLITMKTAECEGVQARRRRISTASAPRACCRRTDPRQLTT